MIDRDVTRDQVKSMFPDATAVPIILLDGDRLGGTAELQLLMENQKQYLTEA